MKLLTVLLLIALILVAFCDFKYMAVPLYILLIAVVLSLIRLVAINGVSRGFMFAAINCTGCLAVLIFSFLVLFLIRMKIFNPLDVLIGTGDLMFFPVVCFSFSPANFIVFFILSLAIILLFKSFINRVKNTFPLAGGLSVLLVLVLLTGMVIPFNCYDDSFILNFIFSR